MSARSSVHFEHAQHQSPPPPAGEGWVGANRQPAEKSITHRTVKRELYFSATGPFAPIPAFPRARGKEQITRPSSCAAFKTHTP